MSKFSLTGTAAICAAALALGAGSQAAHASIITSNFEFDSSATSNPNGTGWVSNYIVAGNMGVDSTIVGTSLSGNTLTSEMGNSVADFGIYQVKQASGVLFALDTALTAALAGSSPSFITGAEGKYYTSLTTNVTSGSKTVSQTITGGAASTKTVSITGDAGASASVSGSYTNGVPTGYKSNDAYYIARNGAVYDLFNFNAMAAVGTIANNDNLLAAGYNAADVTASNPKGAVYGIDLQGLGFQIDYPTLFASQAIDLSWDNGNTKGDLLNASGNFIPNNGQLIGTLYIPGDGSGNNSLLVDSLVAANPKPVTASVPEPLTVILLGSGLLGLGLARRRSNA